MCGIGGLIGSLACEKPALANLGPGCTFAPRCAFADDTCRAQYPAYEAKAAGHWAACWHSDRVAAAGARA